MKSIFLAGLLSMAVLAFSANASASDSCGANRDSSDIKFKGSGPFSLSTYTLSLAFSDDPIGLTYSSDFGIDKATVFIIDGDKVGVAGPNAVSSSCSRDRLFNGSNEVCRKMVSDALKSIAQARRGFIESGDAAVDREKRTALDCASKTLAKFAERVRQIQAGERAMKSTREAEAKVKRLPITGVTASTESSQKHSAGNADL